MNTRNSMGKAPRQRAVLRVDRGLALRSLNSEEKVLRALLRRRARTEEELTGFEEQARIRVERVAELLRNLYSTDAIAAEFERPSGILVRSTTDSFPVRALAAWRHYREYLVRLRGLIERVPLTHVDVPSVPDPAGPIEGLVAVVARAVLAVLTFAAISVASGWFSEIGVQLLASRCWLAVQGIGVQLGACS